MRTLILGLALLLFSGSPGAGEEGAPAAATEVAPAAAPQAVQWFYPRRGRKLKDGRTEVILTGRTLPDTPVVPKAEGLATMSADGQIHVLKAKSSIISKTVRADSQGYFTIRLALPAGNAQIPLEMKTGGGDTTFQLNLNVQEKKLELNNAGELKADRGYRHGHSLWFGVGVTEMRYSEDSNDVDTHLTFTSVKGPAYYFEGKYALTDQWRLVGAINNSTGDAKSSTSVTVNGSGYNWNIYSLEGLYLPNRWRFEWLGRGATTGVRFGVQEHAMPYLNKVTTDLVSIKNYPVAMATLGPEVDMRVTHTTNLEIFMRYQYPLMASGTFKISPGFTFDGSIGATTMITSEWSAGLFWYGQLQHYTYRFSQGGTTSTGRQQIFFSSLNARIGYVFP